MLLLGFILEQSCCETLVIKRRFDRFLHVGQYDIYVRTKVEAIFVTAKFVFLFASVTPDWAARIAIESAMVRWWRRWSAWGRTRLRIATRWLLIFFLAATCLLIFDPGTSTHKPPLPCFMINSSDERHRRNLLGSRTGNAMGNCPISNHCTYPCPLGGYIRVIWTERRK